MVFKVYFFSCQPLWWPGSEGKTSVALWAIIYILLMY